MEEIRLFTVGVLCENIFKSETQKIWNATQMEFYFTKLFACNEHMKWPVDCSIEKKL